LPVTNALVGENVVPVEHRDYSFIVSFMNFDLVNFDRAHNHLCTGSLLTRTHVLSAAHCIANRLKNETVILFGSNNLNQCVGHQILWWINYIEWAEYRRRHIQFETNDLSITRVNELFF
jgi:secreted trypsin-like serine protease